MIIPEKVEKKSKGNVLSHYGGGNNIHERINSHEHSYWSI